MIRPIFSCLFLLLFLQQNPKSMKLFIISLVLLGLAFAGKFSTELICGYIISQLLGGIFGSWLVYIIYIDHYRETSDESSVMGTFCTSPAIRNYKNNYPFFDLFLRIIFSCVNLLIFCFSKE
mgnify:CR=1 FL=1